MKTRIMILLVAVNMVLLLMSCRSSTAPDPQVGTPIFSPGGGTYNTVQVVHISTDLVDATIRFTIDGSEPTEESPEYTEPFGVGISMTIKARAYKDGFRPSEIAAETYVIELLDDFQITRQLYFPTEDFDLLVSIKFGEDYRLADWDDIIAYIDSESIDDFVTMISFTLTGENSEFFISRQGERFFDDTEDHYFITRHDPDTTVLPDPVHDDIDNNHLVLSSASGVAMKILAYRDTDNGDGEE